uniref:COMM domain-containing protein n=1 Tax=Timema poppense TaxID=170557 RepID=A0A7R9DGC6_TIMPO|nr:unnamed protein product [Timema poppensis]
MSAALPVGPPRLLDFSCQTCSKSSVTDAGDTSVSCLLKMKIQNISSDVKDLPEISTVTLELQHSTLNTLLDGLGRIRDQLTSVAIKK